MTAEQRLMQHITGIFHGQELARLTRNSPVAAQAVRGHLRRVCRALPPELAEIYRQGIEDGYTVNKE